MFSWLVELFYLREKKEKTLLIEVFDRCINKNTYILGFPGSGKSTFLEQITNRIYYQKKSYILCGNSISCLNNHFHKHSQEDNVLIFTMEGENTHSIDIDHLFSLTNFLKYVCIEEKIEELKEKRKEKWTKIFSDESNKVFFKEKMFDFILELIKNGYIEEKGNINKEIIVNPLYVYCALADNAKFSFTDEEKEKYIHLLNFIQISINEEINVIFDEERIFFKSHQNDCDKQIILKELNNKYILTAQLLFKLTNEQLVCFKSVYQANELDISQYMRNNIRYLNPGEFYFLNKKGEFYTEEKLKLIFEKTKKAELNIEHFFNNKRKKLHDFLQKDLNNIKDFVHKKPQKI